MLRLDRKPLDRQTGDDRGEPLDTAGEIVADSRRVALDDGHRRKGAPQHRNEGRLAFERDNPLGPASGPDEAAGQTAGPGAQLKDRTRARQVDAACDSIGEPCAARFGAAAMRRGFCNQRAKKTPASACMRSPVSIG